MALARSAEIPACLPSTLHMFIQLFSSSLLAFHDGLDADACASPVPVALMVRVSSVPRRRDAAAVARGDAMT